MYKPGTVDEMISIISAGKGVAQANLYYVHIPQVNGELDTKTLGYLCSSVALPSRQLSAVDRQVGLDRRQVVYGYSNGNVSMNFRVLNDQRVRQFFEEWQQSIVVSGEDGNEGDYGVAFPNDYIRPIHIYQLERGTSFPIANKNFSKSIGPINVNLELDFDAGLEGKANYHWVLEGAYPQTFQNETLSDGSQGTISEFTIEFAYKNWKGEKMTEKSRLGVTGSAQISSDIGSKLGNKVYDILKV